jgi:hypothetical protein
MQLHKNLYASPNINTAIKLRRMRWEEHVENMGEMRNMYNILIGKLGGKKPFRRPRCRWKIILKWLLRK